MRNPEIAEAAFLQTIREEVELAKCMAPTPTTDMDLIWAVSSTGTVYEAADLGPDNPYSGINFDKGIVDESVRLVRGVTALRLDKSVTRITNDDIETAGPSLLYNGEHQGMPGGKFPMQTDHFNQYVREPGFEVPLSNIIVGEIEDVNTHAQVRQLAGLLYDQPEFQKFAAACGIGHGVRVGRYIQHLRHLFPEGTGIVPAFVSQGTGHDDKIANLEAIKAWKYLQKGDLALRSAFFQV